MWIGGKESFYTKLGLIKGLFTGLGTLEDP